MMLVSQVLQGLLFIALAGTGVALFLLWQAHMDKRRSIKNAHDLERTMVAFEQSKLDTAQMARVRGVVIEYGANNTLKAVFDYPQPTSSYNIEMEKSPDPKQLASPHLIIPQAPPFRAISHLMTPQRIITAFTAQGPVYGEVSDLLSMALIGKPKRGKTTALLYYLCILLQSGAEVWIWDPHGEMSELSYGLHYYDSLEEIAASVPLLWNSLNEREELYRQTKQVKHPLVLLVDEVPVIADWEKEQVKQKRKIYSPYRVMKRFTLEARKWNGYVFISGQSLPSTVLPTLTRDNLSSRLVLECSADHARMVGLPKDAIDTLLPHLKGADRGTHIADFSSWSHPELADIPYTTIGDLRHIIDGRGVNAGERHSPPFTEPDESVHYVHPVFTKSPVWQDTVVTGELVNTTVNEPVNAGERHSPIPENVIEVTPEERAKIIQLAHVQFKMYGKVVRTKIRDAMGWNNKDFPKIKQVLDQEGL